MTRLPKKILKSTLSQVVDLANESISREVKMAYAKLAITLVDVAYSYEIGQLRINRSEKSLT